MSSASAENRLLFARIATELILECGCGKGLYEDMLERRGETVGADVKKEYLVKSSYQNKLTCSVTRAHTQSIVSLNGFAFYRRYR